MPSFDLENVSLRYPVFQVTKSMRSAVKSVMTGGLIDRKGRYGVEVVALNNVSLSAREGDRIGLLGHNGAGKTTLLKVLGGIYRPQAGRIRRIGRTVSVLNPSMGLNPSLTGYENIENLMLLAGFGDSDIRARMPDIEEFTELGEFLSLPLNTYSAGMRTRLAFAVATSFHPELLLIDEHLGAGDAAFQKQAQARMRSMMERSSILVFASHQVQMIKSICNRAILMQHGRVIAEGTPEEIAMMYQSNDSGGSSGVHSQI